MIKQPPLVSIIIPIYNAERYLATTIKSILSQDFLDYEIILLNDGSKDNSAKIAQDFTSGKDNIIFIDKPNEGVAITRNRGIELSKGKYIMFIDADDILFPNTLKAIAEASKNGDVDIIRFEHQTIDENGNSLYPNRYFRLRKKYANKDLDATTFMDKVMLNEYYMCMNLYKASLIKEYKISFLKGCTYNEDTLFIINVLKHSIRHVYLPIFVYGYRKTNDTVTADFTIKNYQDVKKVSEAIFTISAESNQTNKSKSFKSVAETLALTLYQKRSTLGLPSSDLEQLMTKCISHPILLEWKFVALFGKYGAQTWNAISFIKKLRRILF